jgi:hypothetical protein
VTYQNIRLEPRVPNFHFTWVSKWTWCLLLPKKRLFWPKTPNTPIFPNYTNWVMWAIKIFGLSQGFLISNWLGSQNELGVYHNQKRPFLTQNAKHLYYSKSFKLGHVSYQNTQLEPRVPNFHFTWVSKWTWCLSRPKKRLFWPKTPNTRIFPSHSNWVMWPIKTFGLSQEFLIFHFTWVSKWTRCLLRPKKTFFDPKRQSPVFFLLIQTGSCDLSKYSAWAKGS